MLLFFYGAEMLQSQEKVTALIDKFLAKNPSGAGLSQLDCADGATLQDVCDALFSASLFTVRRLVVIKNPFALVASDQRALAQKLENIVSDDVVVLWEQGTVRTNAVLFKKLQASAQTIKEYTVPRGQAYVTWIARRLNHIVPGMTIARSAAVELIERIGDDLIRMNTTIAQCAAYARGSRVTCEAVEALVVTRAEADVFRAVDAATSGNRSQALELLMAQCAAGEDAFKLFGLYAYHLRSLLAVSDCVARGITDRKAIAQETGLKPFVVTKATGIVQKITADRLARAHALLVQLDRSVKTGTLSMQDALQEFVIKI